jgi:hypothetical protein
MIYFFAFIGIVSTVFWIIGLLTNETGFDKLERNMLEKYTKPKF